MFRLDENRNWKEKKVMRKKCGKRKICEKESWFDMLNIKERYKK